MSSERIDDGCRGAKINHVFRRIGAMGAAKGMEEGGVLQTAPEKDRASGRDSVTQSVDRCRIVYLISGVINQESRPTLKRRGTWLAIAGVTPNGRRNEDERAAGAAWNAPLLAITRHRSSVL
jgi:hypothetical protein